MRIGNPFSGYLFTLTIIAVTLVLQTAVSVKSTAKTSPSKVSITSSVTSMPLSFTENQGQWDNRVKFRANAGGATMWFSPDGAYYQFSRVTASDDDKPISIVDKRYGMPVNDAFDREPKPYETLMIKANFVGANANPVMVGIDMIEYKCNYFIGNDHSKWVTNVPNFTAVMYENIYDGIDLKYYGNGTQMEYDFIVSSGADYSQIEIQYEGAESISINDNGELVVTTKWGEVVEQRPIVYQLVNNSRTPIEGTYKLRGDNSFGFELSGSYDPSLPLIIDPVLSYSTYLGGSSLDLGFDVAVDVFGSAYIVGYTSSSNFPIAGEFQTYQGDRDVFVTKLNSSGSSLVYSTYLGGSRDDYGRGVSLDSLNNVYITGYTYSTDFPTVGEFQSNLDTTDVFVTKLNSAGNALIYSTYLGGSNIDRGFDIALDGSYNAYIIGYTYSIDFPTLGQYQSNQDTIDVFVTKLNSSGNALIYSTYLGGSNIDIGYEIALDGSYNAYVTGYTHSTDFPILGEYQSNQDTIDVFVTKLNSSGNALIYSTYLGGSDIEIGYGIALDGFDNAYITGYTQSADFPTANAFQATNQGGRDVFVTKLDSTGNTLVYSTYLGGTGTDAGYDIALDKSNYSYVTGYTYSTNYPTNSAYQATNQGLSDAIVSVLNTSGNVLDFSTYLGGSSFIFGGNDFGYSIILDTADNIYITGSTDSPINFPTEGEFQTSQGIIDAFVTKFGDNPVSCCVANRGDLNGDGDDANILDLTFAVDRIFRGGPASDCEEEGDVNNDGGSVNILDLTFLVDRIFRGGVAPDPC